MGIFATQLAIANAALLRAGGRKIASFSDGTKEADLASTYLLLAAREAVKDHTWNDLLITAIRAGITPTALASPRASEKYISVAASDSWSVDGAVAASTTLTAHATLPLAHIVNVVVSGVAGSFPYKVEGPRIVSGAWPSGTPDVAVVYCAVPMSSTDLDTTKLNDPLLNEAIILKLAQKLAFSLTANLQSEAKLMQEYQQIIQQARIRDGLEHTGEESPTVSQLWNPTLGGTGGQQ